MTIWDLYLKKCAAIFGKGKTYHYYIFSKGGFKERLKSAADKGEVTTKSEQVNIYMY